MANTKTIETNMFYKATPSIFQNAKYLRQNMTLEEKILWEKLRKNQLGVRFKPQHPIENFIVDFYCHKAKLIIEIDGEVHNFQKPYDLGREAELKKYELKIIRFTNKEVIDTIDLVINKIKKKLHEISTNNQ